MPMLLLLEPLALLQVGLMRRQVGLLLLLR